MSERNRQTQSLHKTHVEHTSDQVDSQALVIAGHGSFHDPAASTPIISHVNRARHRDVFNEVREAFWKGDPSLRDVLGTLHSDVVYIVPFLMSDGYFARDVFPRELQLGEPDERKEDKTISYTEPVGTHDRLTEVIIDRVESITTDPNISVIVCGHGTKQNAHSAESTRYHAERIREQNRFTGVHALFLDQDPLLSDYRSFITTLDVVVVPLFASNGPHTTTDIPKALGVTQEREGTLHETIDSHEIWVTGAVGTDPLLTEVILDRALEAGAVNRLPNPQSQTHRIDTREQIIETFVTSVSDGIQFEGVTITPNEETVTIRAPSWNETIRFQALPRIANRHYPIIADWYYWEHVIGDRDSSHRAFLRWFENADELSPSDRFELLRTGITKSWGELKLIGTRTTTGERQYEIRHTADDETPQQALTTFSDPLKAREIARFDSTGRYRPLASARTLQTGWRITNLSGLELVQAVDLFYPASIENWYRELSNSLTIRHYTTATARQTGRYSGVEDLDDNELESLTEFVCGGCVKRREWRETEDTAEAVPSDGEFPCPEPCSFFIAVARESQTTNTFTVNDLQNQLKPPTHKESSVQIDGKQIPLIIGDRTPSQPNEWCIDQGEPK